MNILNSNKILLLSIIILIFIIIIYRALNFNNVETFVNSHNEKYGNSLIKRNLSNISLENFGMNTNKGDILLESPHKGLNSLKRSSILLTLGLQHRLTAIETKGVKHLIISYSNDNINYNNSKKIVVNDGINILNINLIGKYFKFNIGDNVRNVKMDIYGLPSSSTDYSQITSDNIISGVNIKHIISRGKKVYEVRMPNSIDYLVSKINFNGNLGEFHIVYKNHLISQTYKTPCNETYNMSSNKITNTTVYFNHPTLINKMVIVPHNETTSMKNLQIYGKKINNKSRYLEQSMIKCSELFEDLPMNNTTNNTINNTINNNTNDNVNVNLETDDLMSNYNKMNKICQAIEYQDEIQQEKVKLDKTKQYYIKLQKQQDEIKELEETIQKLKEYKDKKIENDDMLNLAKFESQTSTEAQLTDIVRKRLDGQQKLDVEVNVSPYKK